MSLYNTSEFLTLVKEDIGIKDIPVPVDDVELLRRMEMSALKDFSMRAPRIETINIDENNRMKDREPSGRFNMITYEIPRWAYIGTSILAVTRLDISRPAGYNDLYVPQGSYASPDQVLSAIADIKMISSVSSAMGRAPTIKFNPPNVLQVYNGWAHGVYEIDLALVHDISLITIPPTAFTQLRELCVLDLEEFLYNKLKRKESLDLGVASINLRIDDWADSGNRKRDLLKEWDQNGANLDIDSITYF